MLADWYRPGVTLDFPKGGSGAIVDALVRGVRKHDGKVCLNSHVDEIVVENGQAVGVTLANGQTIRAKQAVVSNADPYVTNRLLTKATESKAMSEEAIEYMQKLVNVDDDTFPGEVATGLLF